MSHLRVIERLEDMLRTALEISDYDNNVWEPGVFGWHEEVSA